MQTCFYIKQKNFTNEIRYADTIQKRTTRVQITKDLSWGNYRGGISGYSEILHPGARIERSFSIGEYNNDPRPMWTASSTTFRVHIRSMRGKTESAERSSASLHPEEAAAGQDLPPADYGAGERSIVILSADRCTHSTFLCTLTRMIFIERCKNQWYALEPLVLKRFGLGGFLCSFLGLLLKLLCTFWQLVVTNFMLHIRLY